jgi:hypothetical protein
MVQRGIAVSAYSTSLLVALSLTLAHCSCQPPSTTCRADDECPTGYRCRGSLCTRITAADSGSGDTNSGDAVQADVGPHDMGQSDTVALDLAPADAGVADRANTDCGPAPDSTSADNPRADAASPRRCMDAGPGHPADAGCGTVSVFSDTLDTGDRWRWSSQCGPGVMCSFEG